MTFPRQVDAAFQIGLHPAKNAYTLPAMKKLQFIALLCLALLPSCATQKKPLGPQGSFSVKTVPFFGNDVHVFVEVSERTNGPRGPVLSSKRVTGDGVTGFVVPLGKIYSVHAYADLDHNGKQGPSDPSATVEGLRPVSDMDAMQAPAILTLPGTGVAPDWPGKKLSNDNSPASNEAPQQKAADKVQEASPGLPVPPPPAPTLPVPPPPQ